MDRQRARWSVHARPPVRLEVKPQWNPKPPVHAPCPHGACKSAQCDCPCHYGRASRPNEGIYQCRSFFPRCADCRTRTASTHSLAAACATADHTSPIRPTSPRCKTPITNAGSTTRPRSRCTPVQEIGGELYASEDAYATEAEAQAECTRLIRDFHRRAGDAGLTMIPTAKLN